MAKNVKINSRGALQLLNSAPIVEDITRRAEQIAAAAGEGFEAEVVHTDRAHANIRATTFEAAARNAKHNTLIKALGAGR